MPKLSPAEYVIKAFGGVRALARAIKMTPGSFSKWKNIKGRNISGETQQKILRAAKRLRLDVTPNDLMCGRIV